MDAVRPTVARRFEYGMEVLLGTARMVGVWAWTATWILLAFVCMVVTLRRSTALVMARRWWAPGVLRIAGAKLEILPLPALDWSRPYVFVMNHESVLDIPAAFAALPPNLHFVAKHSLQYVPFIGWYIWATGMVFIDRSNKKKSVASLARAAERIRTGTSVIVYPEGTRSKDGGIQPFKRGAFALALAAKVPIVPVVITGTREVLATGGIAFRPGHARLKVGEPVETAHRDVEERGALAQEMFERVSQLRADLEKAGRS